ncbi:hypothetical protein CC80DRAFT_160521 [Byssothecium circinans]|uniref:BTB domain-containing protein n=1 Tax=Byssothecium circinans TaxID=147558 RepID=A0A6A5UDM2_9PLEO|nr:hypothetical protein CC80DRAFT_160521 [Byssothecium circinans]
MAKKKKGAKQLSVPEPEPPSDESTAQSTSCAQLISQRPKTSPYTSSPVALRIGPEKSVSYVPRDLLQNLDWMASAWSGEISLADVDENTGHVLVHYLFTGAYQTLYNTGASLIDEVNIEFKRAVLAYTAAKKCRLHGLRELAKNEIQRFGTEMDIFAVIEAVKDDFSKLLGDTAWFHAYLDEKVEAVFEEDRTVFEGDKFFDRVNDVGLARVLAKCVARLYNNKIERMLSAERVPVVGTSEECRPDMSDPPIDEAVVEESFTVEAIPEEDCPCSALECVAEEDPADDCPL